MIFIAIGVLIIAYGFKNYKKAFMLYLIYKIILVTNITILSIPGIPLLTVEMFMDLAFVIMFLLNRKKLCKKRFPFKVPFILLTALYFLSTILSIAGITATISSSIKQVCEEILIVYLLYRVLDSREDYLFVFKGISIIIFLSCLYGIWEQFAHTNPIVEYESTLNNDISKVINFTYIDDARGWRTQSFFEHAIGAGMIWATYILIYLTAKIRFNVKFKFEMFYIVTCILSLICIYFVRSRTPLIFLLIGVLATFGFANKTQTIYTLCAVLLITLIILFATVTDSWNKLDDVYQGGSTLSMRIKQFEDAFKLMQYSPLYGLGYKYSTIISSRELTGLLGGESIWLVVIPTFGIFGIFVYLLYSVFMILVVPYKSRSKEMFFISLGYWVAITVSSVPGYKTYLIFILLFFIIEEKRTLPNLSPLETIMHKEGTLNYDYS